MRSVIGLAPLLMAVMVLPGCSTIEYYAQAIGGQLEMLRVARSVDTVMDDAESPTALRARLKLAGEIRNFASRELGLPDNASYRRYADLRRPFVVWNLVSAPELSVKPIEHCFPIAGCVSYRGYYAEADARRQAEAEKALGRDAYVGGVPAYSTLGWFDDPLLNTFVGYPEPELARLIFHELSHQVAYAGGDTVFNESFATVVEEEGVRRWLEHRGTAVSEAERNRYQTLRARRREFIGLVMAYRDRFDAVYKNSADDAAKRAGKAVQVAAFEADYQKLKASWDGFAGYDRIVASGVNNALVAAIASYTELVPPLTALLRSKESDLAVFYREAKALARLSKAERQKKLSTLTAALS